MESYANIELDEEDLRRAREEKHYRLERIKYLESVREFKPAKRFTAEEYYQAFTQIFPIDKLKERDYYIIVTRLCCYFSNDKRFETKELQLNRGIILFGGVGVGKSTLMQMFRQNQAYSYRIMPCREVESEFGTDGNEAIAKYSTNIPIDQNAYGQTELGYCFDDLGTENSLTKHFGNAKKVMTDIILNRYDKGLDPRATHITTNLSVEEIEAEYGTRVIDRIRENFNQITFPEKMKSRR